MREIKIKTDWSQVTIEEYQNFVALTKILAQTPDDPIALLDFNIGVLEIFSDQSLYDIEEMSRTDFEQCLSHLEFIKDIPPTNQPKSDYIIGGKKYDISGAAKRLSELSVRDLKAIQYIDYQKVGEIKNEQGYIETLDTELAVLLVAEDESYGSDDFSVSANAERIRKNLNICDALAISAFFFEQYKALTKTTERYLESKIKKMERMMRKAKTPQIQENIMKIKTQLINLKSQIHLR